MSWAFATPQRPPNEGFSCKWNHSKNHMVPYVHTCSHQSIVILCVCSRPAWHAVIIDKSRPLTFPFVLEVGQVVPYLRQNRYISSKHSEEKRAEQWITVGGIQKPMLEDTCGTSQESVFIIFLHLSQCKHNKIVQSKRPYRPAHSLQWPHCWAHFRQDLVSGSIPLSFQMLRAAEQPWLELSRFW